MRVWANTTIVGPLFIGIAAFLPGCATVRPVEAPNEPVQAMTSVDGTAQRLAFETRHGGRFGWPGLPDAAGAVLRLTSRGWTGPDVTVATLTSQNPNAYVLADGHVYMTAGLLDLVCTEDELAAVLAHEIAHLEDLSGFTNADMGMEDRLRIEVEADRRAADRLVRLGYEPTALITMIERLSSEQADGWARQRREELISFLYAQWEGGGIGDIGAASPSYCEALTGHDR
ncbi:MAG: M48 family metalloprotease [Phycisphaerales bacterium]|nr:M48 family metalloprotease [Phycisphaerales bacterium]